MWMRLTERMREFIPKTGCCMLKIQFVILRDEEIGDPLKTHTPKTTKIGTENLVVEHVVTTPTCSATKFTVPIFAVFNVRVYNTCI